MSKFFIWYLLARATGSPLASAIGLLIFYWAIDRYTLGVLPDPFRFVNFVRKQWRLETHLKHAPHDRKARTDLAEVYLQRKQYAKAVDVLRPNLEAGDDDVVTVFNMGVACLGAGHTAQGEKLLAHALEMDPDFRSGELHLALGRFRLARGDFAGAKQALEQLVNLRKGTVEGRVLLSRALEGLKDDGAAALTRDQAWDEYVAAPRFQRRRERLWAWRARPSRPAIYAVAVVIALGLFGRFVAPQLGNLGSGSDADPYGYGYGGYAPSVAAAAVASCTRPGACNEWVDPDGPMLSALRSTCEQSGQQFAEGPCARTNITGRCQAAGGHLFMFWYAGAPPGEDQKHACDTMRGSYSTTP